MKRTNWFPAHIRPSNFGVYEVKSRSGSVTYSYWNGQNWGLNSGTVDEAEVDKDYRSAWQEKEWRGILE